MADSWLQQLEAWHDFYVIVGSAAAGLTGLMFVVVSLSTHPREAAGMRAFVTPTVVYLTTVLVVASVMTIPTTTAVVVGGALALGSAGALIYMMIIGGHRTWRQNKLDRLDWCWYVVLPISSYVLTLAAAVAIVARAPFGLEIVGGTMILLLVIGIRNAWDLVTWMTQQRRA